MPPGRVYTAGVKTRAYDPRRLDLATFAAEAARLEGTWAGADLRRLAESQALPQDAGAADVAWQCAGEQRPVSGQVPEVWLQLRARTEVWLICQRCLQPLRQPLEVDRRLRFVRSEAEAETLDAESEDDVLALPHRLDLRELIEDELLLALPLVPRHDACGQPLPLGAAPPASEAESTANPFALLQSLKSGRSGAP